MSRLMVAHIGYHKTGTTFLQKNVFPNIKNVNNVGSLDCIHLFREVIYKPSLDFNREKTKNEIQAYAHTGKTNLYSFEGLVGIMGVGHYNQEIADRLKEVGFERIIITIRSQVKMAESIYKQYIQQGGVVKVKDFFAEDSLLFNIGYLQYYKLIAYYIHVFGKDNVLVVLQENMRENPAATYQMMTDFLNVKTQDFPTSNQSKGNKSLSNLAIHLLRITNHFTYNYYRPSQLISKKIHTMKFRGLFQRYLDPMFFSKISSKKSLLDENLKEKIKIACVEHNQLLSQELGIDLKKYGYP